MTPARRKARPHQGDRAFVVSAYARTDGAPQPEGQGYGARMSELPYTIPPHVLAGRDQRRAEAEDRLDELIEAYRRTVDEHGGEDAWKMAVLLLHPRLEPAQAALIGAAAIRRLAERE